MMPDIQTIPVQFSRPARKARRGALTFLVLLIMLPASMLLLPYLLLYFIDPSLADIFMTYSFPYIAIILVVLLVVFGLIFGLSALAARRNPPEGQILLTSQPSIENNSRSVESPQVITVKEREIVREIVKVRCHYCGTLNPETAAKCESCGANI